MPVAEFIQFDPQGILTKEQWAATSLHCPRCGRGGGAVWVLISESPLKVGHLETRVFLCIACQFVAVGLNGFTPQWNAADRAEQIIKHGFASEEQ